MFNFSSLIPNLAPSADALLENIYTYTSTIDISTIEDQSKDCAICLLPFSSDHAPIRTWCGHLFCAESLSHWILCGTSQGCPTCRQPLFETVEARLRVFAPRILALNITPPDARANMHCFLLRVLNPRHSTTIYSGANYDELPVPLFVNGLDLIAAHNTIDYFISQLRGLQHCQGAFVAARRAVLYQFLDLLISPSQTQFPELIQVSYSGARFFPEWEQPDETDLTRHVEYLPFKYRERAYDEVLRRLDGKYVRPGYLINELDGHATNRTRQALRMDRSITEEQLEARVREEMRGARPVIEAIARNVGTLDMLRQEYWGWSAFPLQPEPWPSTEFW